MDIVKSRTVNTVLRWWCFSTRVGDFHIDGKVRFQFQEENTIMKNTHTVKYRPIRKNFPKVFQYEKNGRDYYLVDGRSRKWGLNIRKNFNNQKDSLDYSRELENKILERGKNVSNDVIYQNKEVEKLVERLKPFGKSLNESVTFFVQHLQKEIQKSIIPSIEELCLKWYDEKTKDELEPLRNRTRVEYKSHFNYITRTLGPLKPLT